MKITTIRITENMNKQIEEYANVNDLSKNQVVKMALRKLFEKE